MELRLPPFRLPVVRLPVPVKRFSGVLGLICLGLLLERFHIPLPRWQPAGLLAPLRPQGQRLRAEEIPLSTPDGLQVLKEAIKAADDRHRPKMLVDPLGQVSYRYSLREGEAKKSEAELKKLLETSRQNENYTRKIYRLLDTLSSHGVSVVIGEPLKKGASGEWDPSMQVLRLSPKSLTMGSEVILEILNHESVHVAQSCKGGGINYRPQPLDLPLSPARITSKPLKSDVYSSISAVQRRLEQEAYSYEYSNRAARTLLAEHCH